MRDTVDIVRRLLRDGAVTDYQGEAISIATFDLHFPTFRPEMPIYLAAVFPKMLEIAGEISQGVLLTWCTPEHAQTASRHIAIGAARAGVAPESVEVATLVSVSAPGADDGGMRRVAATYAGRFPRYRRLMAEAGFADEVEEVRRAWRTGDIALAERLVPEGLIDRMSLPSDRGRQAGKVGRIPGSRPHVADHRSPGIRPQRRRDRETDNPRKRAGLASRKTRRAIRPPAARATTG